MTVESIAEAFLNDNGDLRVDTRRGPCRWFRIFNGAAQSLSLRSVWQLAQGAATRAGIRASQTDIARAIRAAQARVPLLTEGEWNHQARATLRASIRQAHAQRRAA